MIDRQDISKALAGLSPEDREILDYSLRRRVPDADLATIFSSSASEIARRRAGAIEQLSSVLGVERGADLGDLLKGLLETATWDGLAAETKAADEAAAQSARATAAAAPDVGGHRPLGANAPAGAAAPSEQPPAVAPAAESATGSRGARRMVLATAVAVAVLVPAGVVWALNRDTGSPSGAGAESSGAAANGGIAPFDPQDAKSPEPFPADPQVKGQYPTARLSRKTALYDAPDGKVRLRVSANTEWKSPRILSIVGRKGPWLAVLVPELKNGQKAWVRDDKVGSIDAVNWAIDADLSKRQIVVRHEGKVVRTVRVGVGRTGHSTPTGRFAVTDRLRVTDTSGPYGCCVLALTGHQTRLPSGWPGGDRLAIHATQDLSGLGRAVSLGCMRTDPRDTRWLLKRIPLGTPVTIKA